MIGNLEIRSQCSVQFSSATQSCLTLCKANVNKSYCSFIYHPKPKSVYILHSWNTKSLRFFLRSIPHQLTVSLPKKDNSFLLWPLLRSYFNETSMCRNSNLFLFLLLICPVSILSFQPQNSGGVEEEISLSSTPHTSYKWVSLALLQCEGHKCREVGRFTHTAH